MKDVVFLYDGCCIYEIAALNYFLSFAGRPVLFCSPGGGRVRSMEGYSLNTDAALSEISPEEGTEALRAAIAQKENAGVQMELDTTVPAAEE